MLHVNVRTVRGRGMVASLGDDGTVAQLRQAVATWFGRDVLHLIYLGRFLRDNTASVKTLCGGLSEEFVVAVLARTKYQVGDHDHDLPVFVLVARSSHSEHPP